MIRGALARMSSGLDEQMREVLGKAILSLAIRVGGAAAQFAFSVLIARLFGPAGLGAYALALSVVVIASTLARWGLDQATLKHVAIHATRGERSAMRSLVDQGLLVTGVAALVVSLALWLAAPWLCRELFDEPDLSGLLRIMVLSITPFTLLNVLAEAIRGLRKIAVHTLVQGFLVPLFSILLLLIWHFMANTGLSGAAASYAGACLLTAGAAYLLWRETLGRDAVGSVRVDPLPLRALFATASPLGWVALIGVAMSFTETLLLGVYRSSGDVGLYAAALRLALLVNFVMIAFNSILGPKFASLYHESKLQAISALARKSILTMLVVVAPLLFVFVAAPRQVLSLFGSEFGDAAGALVVLSVGQLLGILVGPAGIFLMMTGHERVMRANLVFSYLANLFAGIALIPTLGVMGAALSATIGIVVLNLTCWVSARRALSGPVETG